MAAIKLTPEVESIRNAMKAHIRTLESNLLALRKKLKLRQGALQAIPVGK
jgi:hypothetical protein